MSSVHINADTGYVSPEMMQVLFEADARERARANRRNNPRNPPRGDREQVQFTLQDLEEYFRRDNEAFRARQIGEQAYYARMVQEGEAERRRQDEVWAAERRQREEQQEAARAFAEAEEARRASFRRWVSVLTTLFWLGLALTVGGKVYLSKDVEMAAQTAPGSELAIVKIKPEEVIANAFKDLFVSHAGIIEKSMTPSSLNEVQGRALFEVLSTEEEEEEDCCAIDDVFCRLAAVAPKYVPAFLQPYLLGPQEEDEVDDNPIHSFAWVVTVWDRSIYRDTTPWFLPTGPTDENSGVSFYQLEQGHSRNPDIEEEDLKVQQENAEDFEVCAESDSLFDILSRVFTFSENSRIQETIWYARTPSSPKTDLNGLLAQADARYRELPSIKWHHHLQGSLLYETTREYSNYETECELLWTKNPAFRPKTLWQKLQDDLFRKDKPHMPPIRRRSCTDLSPASSGADPVEIAVCHAYARDPQPINYDIFPLKDFSAEMPRYIKHVQGKVSAMPPVSESCHTREFLKYEVLQQHYDYTGFCEALWVSFPHTSPWAPRKTRVRRDDGSVSTYWQEEYLKKPHLEGLESFCLDHYFDRARGFGFDWYSDPTRGRDMPNADDFGLWLFHSA